MPNQFEEMVSKGAGAAGAAAARIKGLSGVFVTLSEEHRAARTLLQRALASGDAAKRADLWGRLRRELLAHERAELQEIYPLLQGARGQAQAIPLKHGEQALVLEACVEDVERASFESSEWHDALERLAQALDQHTHEEEAEFFPRAQEALGKDMAKDLDERYKVAKSAFLGAV